MTPRTLKTACTSIGSLLLLLGTQPLVAECVSASIANETFYSCSGVLTVVPKEASDAVVLETPAQTPVPDGAQSKADGEKPGKRAPNDHDPVGRPKR